MLERLSLMTFTIDVDIAMKKMTARECLQMAADEGLQYVRCAQSVGSSSESIFLCRKGNGRKGSLLYCASVLFLQQG